ncbi:ribonuclease HII [Nesterenkonia alkaliphila]|uniref:Ribonuclease n=1 Tax=Nesterenkonia alkaliphila TaxID=1463631 RepID=A0A7K1UM26_9MICC|nr:ribonuclease HII [Nesterenkonia alkaliphila]MVT27476.1 ribonuclease HII [Nesterenkonia alkaliphila]GFZ89385.1 ribonuclease HII [Nesterenkonia alkaliphila]
MSPSSATNATLRPELALARETGARLIAGVDEVGRGALAGPVTVGVVVIDLDALPAEVIAAETGVWPVLDGVRDSKLLSPGMRKSWHPSICEQAQAYSVQHSAAELIDAAGISAAMGAAGRAGLAEVTERLGRPPDVVLLDGIHNWLQAPEVPVRTMAKADTLALSVACASVLAKVERDGLMEDLAAAHPEFGWESNKGYGSAQHREAICQLGPTAYHRQSWSLVKPALPGL